MGQVGGVLRVDQRNEEIGKDLFLRVFLKWTYASPLNPNLSILEGVRLSQLELTMKES